LSIGHDTFRGEPCIDENLRVVVSIDDLDNRPNQLVITEDFENVHIVYPQELVYGMTTLNVEPEGYVHATTPTFAITKGWPVGGDWFLARYETVA